MTSLPLPFSSLVSSFETVQRVDLPAFTYGERSMVLDEMMRTLNESGCWLESRRALSSTQIELYFVAMLGAIDELYGGLIGAGVEMTRESHRAMTWLCTLRRHRRESVVLTRTVSIRLEMNFLSEPEEEEMGFVSGGNA
jgi:hypothetical protein